MRRHETFAALARRVARGIAKLERDEVCCGELTLQQWSTLRLLRDDREACTPSALAARLGIDASTATRNVALLELRGYLTRRPSLHDARVVTLELSSRGRACLQTLACDERLVFAKLLAKLPSSERDAVMHALTLLDDALAPSERCCAPRPPVVPHTLGRRRLLRRAGARANKN